DAVRARSATFAHGCRTENRRVSGVTIQDAAVGVPLAVGGGTALVHAVHRLGDEVLGEVAGIGQRPVVAAGTSGASSPRFTSRGGIPVVRVIEGVGVGLVGEAQQRQQVVVVDLPVELAAPEIIVAVGVPGLGRIDIPGTALALFVHAEEEQA